MAQTEHGGGAGELLRVDLTTGTARRVLVPEDALGLADRALAGRSLGGLLLHQALEAHGPLSCDDPRLPLVIAAGTLCATGTPGASRAHVVSRSPLTGGLAESGLCGTLGRELRRCGLLAVELVGHSARPCGLEIIAGQGQNVLVRITDASAFSGQTTGAVLEQLASRLPGAALLTTGPAAETGCLFASLVGPEGNAASRCGLGRVAALKGLKYIAVSGALSEPLATSPAPLSTSPEYARAVEDILRLASASPALLGEHGLARFGTASLYDLLHSRRMMPTDNFARTHFPPAAHLGAHALAERFGPFATPAQGGCPECPIQCAKLTCDGRVLPGVEALSHFTALIGNADLDVALAAHELCVQLGLDPVSAAATLACHREISGADLTAEDLLELLRGMGTGEGEGAALAQGSARYAAAAGRPECSMTVKGLELPCFDPRGAYGMALGYATSPRGGCHVRAGAHSHEILRKPVATDRFSFSGKARIIKTAEDALAAAQSLGVCPHMLLAASLEEYSRALAAVSGRSVSGGDLLAAGEAVVLRERRINALFGFAAADDDLPERFFSQPGSGDATLAVPPLSHHDFLNARAAYERIRAGKTAGNTTGVHTAETGAEGLAAALRACAAKLVNSGVCAGQNPPLVAALDDSLVFSQARDARQPLMEAVLRLLPVSALLVATPAGVYQAALAELAAQALADGTRSIIPGDCETRTFLHDLPVLGELPVLDEAAAPAIAQALSRRKGCVILAGGAAHIVAYGTVSPDQAYVTASSICFATFVGYFAQYLRLLRTTGVSPAQRAAFAGIAALVPPERADAPDLLRGPFADEGQAHAALIQAGRKTVEYGLVDSYFGNISYRVFENGNAAGPSDTILISQTGSSLDDLAACLDPCRMDGGTCAGLTASSEYSAHKAVYATGSARAILHGHPRFSVILSLDCERVGCPGEGQCHRSCSQPRCVAGVFPGEVGVRRHVPIVPGEVGTGQYGLCNTLPPALNGGNGGNGAKEQGGRRGVIVYGHGLFTLGAQDFTDAFAALMQVERQCREQYFRRVADLGG